MKERKVSWKLPILIIVAIIAVIAIGIFSLQSAPNKAIILEESVYTADSDIKTQEKRRVDLVQNLADCVMQYDKHEAETLKELAANMSNGQEVGSVQTSINAITYAYPELQSNANYNKLMDELITTENLIAQHRENYNSTVGEYKRYVKKFPTRFILDFTGYEVIDFQRLDFNAPVDAPQNLFGE